MTGTPNGIRTRVSALKGRCPRPLDDGGSTRRRERRSENPKYQPPASVPAVPSPASSHSLPSGVSRTSIPDSARRSRTRSASGKATVSVSPRRGPPRAPRPRAQRPARGSRVPASDSRPSSKMSERRLACARSSSSPAGMSVDHSVTSRSRPSTMLVASAMSRAATAAAKSASRSRTRSTSGDVLSDRPALATAHLRSR